MYKNFLLQRYNTATSFPYPNLIYSFPWKKLSVISIHFYSNFVLYIIKAYFNVTRYFFWLNFSSLFEKDIPFIFESYYLLSLCFWDFGSWVLKIKGNCMNTTHIISGKAQEKKFENIYIKAGDFFIEICLLHFKIFFL